MQGCYNQMETIFSPQKRQPLVGVRVTTENTVEHITLRKKNNCLGDKITHELMNEPTIYYTETVKQILF